MQYGMTIRTGVTAQRLAHQPRVTALVTDEDELRADNYVIALGIQSPILSRTAGQDLGLPG